MRKSFILYAVSYAFAPGIEKKDKHNEFKRNDMAGKNTA